MKLKFLLSIKVENEHLIFDPLKIELFMKKISLLFMATGIFWASSCGNTEEVKTDMPMAETVSPEIGPAQELGATVDAAADTLSQQVNQAATETKSKAGTVVEEVKQEVKNASNMIKAETNKAAEKVNTAAKEAAQATKDAAAKAAEKVENTAKDTKEKLKK